MLSRVRNTSCYFAPPSQYHAEIFSVEFLRYSNHFDIQISEMMFVFRFYGMVMKFFRWTKQKYTPSSSTIYPQIWSI